MSAHKQEISRTAYEQEITAALERIAKAGPFQNELAYFVEIAKRHFSLDSHRPAPALVVLGSNIPEELVYVRGQSPYWMLGGSRASCIWADNDVPRDADPVSRSSLGYFKQGFARGSLILVPLVNDSTRKLAYLLKCEGYKVHLFHFPPVKDKLSICCWRPGSKPGFVRPWWKKRQRISGYQENSGRWDERDSTSRNNTKKT